ncbi:hypothetical protein CS022_10785 [Veronia nyctiphanis]|uniref:Uncharacterized protein n=1 Tax=Veronia nyctiphanis TaxID=1278244 RepID=A0A4Q0YQC4_9GAMM|nr:hypothetical protein [Veronia nyctiphanis]RXJ73222.1 hypothetical protein CS022_10785 [Veronia nyctiphanis]
MPIAIALIVLGASSALFTLCWETEITDNARDSDKGRLIGRCFKWIGISQMAGSTMAFTLMGAGHDLALPQSAQVAGLILFAVSSGLAAVFGRLAMSPSVPLAGKTKQLTTPVQGKQKNVGNLLLTGLLALVLLGHTSGSMVAPFLEMHLLEKLNITDISQLSLAYVPGAMLSLLFAEKLGKLVDNMQPARFFAVFGGLGAASSWLLVQTDSLWQVSYCS